MFPIGNCLPKSITLMLKKFKKEVNTWFEYYVWCPIKTVKFLENIVGKNGLYLTNRIQLYSLFSMTDTIFNIIKCVNLYIYLCVLFTIFVKGIL